MSAAVKGNDHVIRNLQNSSKKSQNVLPDIIVPVVNYLYYRYIESFCLFMSGVKKACMIRVSYLNNRR